MQLIKDVKEFLHNFSVNSVLSNKLVFLQFPVTAFLNCSNRFYVDAVYCGSRTTEESYIQFSSVAINSKTLHKVSKSINSIIYKLLAFA